MTHDSLFLNLSESQDVATFESFLKDFISTIKPKWIPVGGRENNAGTIEVSGDPGRALIERITNAIDAVIELEHLKHKGIPEAKSPKEAGFAWFGIPSEGIGGLSNAESQRLANNIRVFLRPGEDRDSRTLQVRDYGIGIAPDKLSETILSLNESNKISKRYLAGAYGQGGSATFSVSKYTLIASKAYQSNTVSFTIVKFQDLPSESYKIGNYVYLTNNGDILQFEDSANLFASGTQITHFGYKLGSYTGTLGPASLYGLFRQVLFDPTLPFWLDFKLKSEYRRVMKGGRNALNSLDTEDEDGKVEHVVPLHYIKIADFGSIGLEYWALSDGKNPSESYVNPRKPIILTLNGQNQAEISSNLIKNDCELPHLVSRLIVHVDCNRLSGEAKRALFVSNREEARKGLLLDMIKGELISSLKNDEILVKMNNEARKKIVENSIKTDDDKVKTEVASILKLQGIEIVESPIEVFNLFSTGPGSPRSSSRGGSTAPEIDIKEPPTFIRFVHSNKNNIKIWHGRNMHLRVETDAPSTYFDHNNPDDSKISFIASNGLIVKGFTPLTNGRMSIIVEVDGSRNVGDVIDIAVEMKRKNLPTTSDTRKLEIVEPPKSSNSRGKITIPPFNFVAIAGPEDERWHDRNWGTDLSEHAFDYEMDSGTIFIYYSEAFPLFNSKHKAYLKSDSIKASVFEQQYRIWLAVSSLLMYRDYEVESKFDDANLDSIEQVKNGEQKRHAINAILFANRETEYIGRLAEVPSK